MDFIGSRRWVMRLCALVGVGAAIGMVAVACAAPQPHTPASGTSALSAPTAPAPDAVKPTVVLVHGA